MAIKENKCWIQVILQDWELSGQSDPSPMQLLVKDMLRVYDFLKPSVVRGGLDLPHWTTDWTSVISEYNIFPPADIKRIGAEKFDKLTVYRKIKLPDGAVYVQVYPGSYEPVDRNIMYDIRKVAQILGLKDRGSL